MKREELIKAREIAGLTQKDMESIGVTRSLYSQIELGTRNPSYAVAKLIARKLKVSIKTIFFDYECYKMRPIKKKSDLPPSPPAA